MADSVHAKKKPRPDFFFGIALETMFAKEDKNSQITLRKSPRLFGLFRDEYGIAIRTQWQSGHAVR